MPARAPLLSTALRTGTAQAHERLEAALDLLSPPLRSERFLHTLERFYGFHRAWEPAVEAQPALAAMPRGESQLPHLREDLRALGCSDAQIDALPSCPDAGRLASRPLEGLGSLYVVEGSALGGQVIARALDQAPWAPSGGLRYFDPHGPQTGARWRAFKAQLDAAAAPSDWPQVIEGAVQTFDTLRVWLAEGETVAPAAPRA